MIFNPQRACAARVTLVSLCVSVCLSTEISYLTQLRVKQEIQATSA